MSSNSRSLRDRVEAERQAHEEDDVLAESYKLKHRFSHIWSYPSLLEMDRIYDDLLSDIYNKTILDYGCGKGEASLSYLKGGAKVFGIDIARQYIEICDELARSNGFASDQFDFRVMDAHKLAFKSNSFDIVAGHGILHHLDSSVAMSEIYRVLKPGGRVLLKEPLGGNPLLKLFRVLTPKARTEDEMPFSGASIELLLEENSWVSESYHCGLVEAAVAVVTSVIMPSKPDNILLKAAHGVESLFRRAGILNYWHQYILISLVKK